MLWVGFHPRCVDKHSIHITSPTPSQIHTHTYKYNLLCPCRLTTQDWITYHGPSLEKTNSPLLSSHLSICGFDVIHVVVFHLRVGPCEIFLSILTCYLVRFCPGNAFLQYIFVLHTQSICLHVLSYIKISWANRNHDLPGSHNLFFSLSVGSPLF